MFIISQDFHHPQKAWGGDEAKHIYFLYENKEIQKKRSLLTYSPWLSTTLSHLGEMSPRKGIKASYDIQMSK